MLAAVIEQELAAHLAEELEKFNKQMQEEVKTA